VSLNVEGADLHPARQHPLRERADPGAWVGIDRGLSTFLVAATSDGAEVARVGHMPKALARGLKRQRQLAKSLSRKKKGSQNRTAAVAKLRRHHHRVVNSRRHFLHRVSNQLVKTHDQLVIEDLNVAGMLRNHRLAQAISDAGWAEFARILGYKQRWRRGVLALADRWYPSSKLRSACGTLNTDMTLADRRFSCTCEYGADRDLNAATNLARLAQIHHDHSSIPGPPSRAPGHQWPPTG
jgi:putative transposase